MEVVFATHNPNKIKEVQNLVPSGIKIKSLEEIGFDQDIEENGETLEENAFIKADTIYDYCGLACFSDDTGLIVPFLDGAPGVFSARYAGEQASADDNMRKLLQELDGQNNRSAYFETVIAFRDSEGKRFSFSGKAEGTITRNRHGLNGFGYDPIFRPIGYSETFAELSLVSKNKISHRAKAFVKFSQFLSTT
ncbi:RdgB/HAM1 family non-canonical purine NTP pyrophosphatase [Sediminicola luteus]|uniref:dITP/XTP pyrophosphatase n=1 Tax=Sediminicola luteus TaxID=319238 RepID=A0A2A4G1V5_9FLAO|nr:RdgB/HAM1 family non-canonical purine NTP pyrophosphatase [Sediminicola luteus]PCE62421.1 non-canonical purine NTP pyrophosphatase, RdgB/HAM1 family [Sediminicola luteus]